MIDDGSRQTRELQAGSGYLSQAPLVARFAVPANQRATAVEVTWPDGTVQRQTLDPNSESESTITIYRK